MDTRGIEANLAKRFGYKPLPPELSDGYRKFYSEHIPSFLNVSGGGKLRTIKKTLLCEFYDRIVIGDYGAFIEYSIPASEYICQPGQEYRMNDPDYIYRVKYDWLTTKDSSGIKIYKQKHTVNYADYKPGKYYVSVHEVING